MWRGPTPASSRLGPLFLSLALPRRRDLDINSRSDGDRIRGLAASSRPLRAHSACSIRHSTAYHKRGAEREALSFGVLLTFPRFGHERLAHESCYVPVIEKVEGSALDALVQHVLPAQQVFIVSLH